MEKVGSSLLKFKEPIFSYLERLLPFIYGGEYVFRQIFSYLNDCPFTPNLVWLYCFTNFGKAKMKEERVFSIINRNGLHIRPCTKLCQIANKYSNRITIFRNKTPPNVRGSVQADPKSILQLLGLGVAYDEEIRIVVEGENAQEIKDILDEISKAIANKFGVEE